MTDEQVERVAKAIEEAQDRYHTDFGLHDYSSYGRPHPHVMRDYRIREGSQAIFVGDDEDEAMAFYTRHRRHTIARAAIAALHPAQQDGWQDIATAPKDGTRILMWDSGPWVASAFNRDGKFIGWDADSHFLSEPTHWQPIAAPPANGAQQ